MKRKISTQDITWFLDLDSKKQLELNPPYQRRSVWPTKDRRYFLDTIFQNFPSPAVFLHKIVDDSGKSTYQVVDGKQRLETILLFAKNEISLSKDLNDARLAGKKWQDLSEEKD